MTVEPTRRDRLGRWLADPSRARHRWAIVSGVIAGCIGLVIGIVPAPRPAGYRPPLMLVAGWVAWVGVGPLVIGAFGYRLWLELVPAEATVIRGAVAGLAIAVVEHAVVSGLLVVQGTLAPGLDPPVLWVLVYFGFGLVFIGWMTLPFGLAIGAGLAYAQSRQVDEE